MNEDPIVEEVRISLLLQAKEVEKKEQHLKEINEDVQVTK